MADEPLHRLEGTSHQRGGLQIKKKPKKLLDDNDDEHFKKPFLSKGSLLGLDVLAERKRELKESQLDEVDKEKRSKVNSYRDDDDEEIVEDYGIDKKKNYGERYRKCITSIQ